MDVVALQISRHLNLFRVWVSGLGFGVLTACWDRSEEENLFLTPCILKHCIFMKAVPSL